MPTETKTLTYLASSEAAGQLVTWAKQQPMLKVKESTVRVPDVRWGKTVGTYPAYEVTIIAPIDAPIPEDSGRGVTYGWGADWPWSYGAPMEYYVSEVPEQIIANLNQMSRNRRAEWAEYAMNWTPPPKKKSIWSWLK